VALSSKLEDFLSPFLAVFPTHSALPKEGQHRWCGSRCCRSPFSSLQHGYPAAPVGSESPQTAEPQHEGLGSDTGNSIKKSSATIPNSGSSCLVAFVCTFAGSKFTSHAEAQTWHGTPGFQYTVSSRVAPESEKRKKQSHLSKESALQS